MIPEAKEGWRIKHVSYITRASLAYALVIAANTLSGWAPCAPSAHGGDALSLFFSLAGPLTFAATWIACMVLGLLKPKAFRTPAVFLALALIYASMALTIAQGQSNQASQALNLIGVVANNMGVPVLYLLWEQYFASEDDDQSIADIVAGRGLPVVFFVLFGLVDDAAVSTGLRALVFLGSAVALLRSYCTVNWDAPMFSEPPLEHMKTYSRVARQTWRSALCVGGIAFANNLLSTILFSGGPVESAFSLAACLAMFVAAAAIFVAWRRHTFVFDVMKLYGMVCPILLVLFLIAPPFVEEFRGVAYATMYVLFAFFVCIGMVQCAQTCRREGVNPIFAFAFFFGIMNVLYVGGYVCGDVLLYASFFGTPQWFTVALIDMFSVSLIFFVVRHRDKGRAEAPSVAEFIALSGALGDQPSKRYGEPSPSSDTYQDKIAKQCANAAARYRLTAREREILELLARGNTIPGIAENLVISPATVQTHCKRLYAKMGIHKRQELVETVSAFGTQTKP